MTLADRFSAAADTNAAALNQTNPLSFTVMRYEDLIENVTAYRATVADNILRMLFLSSRKF